MVAANAGYIGHAVSSQSIVRHDEGYAPVGHYAAPAHYAAPLVHAAPIAHYAAPIAYAGHYDGHDDYVSNSLMSSWNMLQLPLCYYTPLCI